MARKEDVRSMFDSIAWRYDFLNHFLSIGTDYAWRRKAVREMGRMISPGNILDVATGTCDLAIASLKLNPQKVTGVDISQRMLEEGRKKVFRKGLSERIELILGDSEELPFGDNHFDAAMVAFGVRNFENPAVGIAEMYRVIREDGVVMILEFSHPGRFPFSAVYRFYFHYVLPFFGRLFSKDPAAYDYLPESVSSFPEGEEFMEIIGNAGFKDVKRRLLTGGVASIYTGRK
ncbi:MAG: bifunctional demethylmenaquinone methyltransferase/2-methoxy-6-polyprenyl-1,4-benzoquinol methylase UbiE [Bacteroidales bacterium]|nr:bifunctional demethylmenaquinone methyltransferase/2-methoxy-6-polyprenyl-1,4-benzoquinol methylase UbiE [Bacteroidales bacterium]